MFVTSWYVINISIILASSLISKHQMIFFFFF